MALSDATKAEWAAAIRAERARRDLTQAQVAVMAGTTRNTVSAVESGSAGSRMSFRVIAAALGLDLAAVEVDG